MEFAPAPLDSYAQRITSGVAYLGGVLMLPLLFAYLSNLRWNGLLIPVAFAVVLALLLVLTYAAQPMLYRLDKTDMLIKRRWLGTLKVPYKDITGVTPATPLADIPRRGLRFAFNPGIFGYQGPFYLDPYGAVFFLATNRERLVAVGRLGIPPLILSPRRPRAFIEALREQLSGEDPLTNVEQQLEETVSQQGSQQGTQQGTQQNGALRAAASADASPRASAASAADPAAARGDSSA
jgi:hypothetical protein